MSLISEIQQDMDASALQLITEYRDRLFAEAVRLCTDVSSAEDLVCRTLTKAIRNLESHRKGESVFGWMKAIMQNLHCDDMRSPVRRGTTPVDPSVLEEYSEADWKTDEEILKRSDSEALRVALKRLDPEFKKAMVLHYLSEMPVKQIATVMNVPVGTVLWRLSIARKILARDLGEKLGKKPLAVLLAALLGVGTLFGAWVSPLGDWVAEKVFGSAPAVEAVSAQGVDDFSDNKQNETQQVSDQQQVADPQVQEGDETMNIKSALTNTLAVAAVAAAGLGVSAEIEVVSSSADNLEALPAEYARVDYLCSAGDVNAGNAPYIDLEYKATEKTGFEIDFEVLKVIDSYPCPFGACHNGNEKAFTLTGSSSTLSFRWSTATSLGVSFTRPTLGRHRLEVHGQNWDLDGESRVWSPYEEFSLNQSLYVFARNNNGTMDHPTNMRLYGLKIYDGNELKHCLVPCIRVSDVEPGLYDCVAGVEKKFYTKSGAGTFTFPMPEYQIDETLPEAYTRASYLYSTCGDANGNNAPYIDLEYFANELTGLAMDFEVFDGSDDYPCPFGACHAGNAKAFTLTGDLTMLHVFSFRWSTATSSGMTFTVPTLGRHAINAFGKLWTLDVESKTWSKDETFTMEKSLYIFARNNNGTMDHPTNMKLYGLKIYEGVALKHYFVPCVRNSDGEPGLYDCMPGVAKTFYTNSGSGALECPTPISVDCIPAYVSDKPIYGPHPRVRRTLDSSVLAEETDYALSWSDDGNGAGCVTVSGKGAYDSAKVSYQFVGQSEGVFSVKPILPQVYSAASVCMPRPKVRTFDGSRMLVEGTDYDLYWYDNWKIGQGYVVIVGKGEFAGKTWTEPFQIIPRLKGGYKAVSYIKSSGTQYINTGFKPNVTTRADFHFDMEDFAGKLDWAAPFGSRNGDACQFFVGAARKDNTDYWYRRLGAETRGDRSTATQKPPVAGEHVFSLNRNCYWLDGFVDQFGVIHPFGSTYDAYVFAVNDNNTSAYLAPMKLYSLRIWENGTLVRDFIPCVNDKGEAGLYDLTPGATKVFYPNDGSDAFEVGPKAETRGLVVMFW